MNRLKVEALGITIFLTESNGDGAACLELPLLMRVEAHTACETDVILGLYVVAATGCVLSGSGCARVDGFFGSFDCS